MATEKQLRESLLKAHKAGDTEAAQLFANKIKALKAVRGKQYGPKLGGGYEVGAMDPVNAAAQALEQSLPQGARDRINQANNAVRQVPGMGWLAEMPEGGFSQAVQEGEAAYQQGRDGLDWPRLTGNLGVAAPIAAMLPMGKSMRGRVAAGAGSGGLFGALQPVASEGSYWPQKALQATIGAGTGAIMPFLTGSLARMIRPETSPNVQQLVREGVKPTIGQQLGGAANRVEEKMMSMPIVGDAITAARRSGIEELNRAAMNRALSPIGKELPKAVDVGRAGVRYVRRQLSDAYDGLLPKLVGKADDEFVQEINTIRQMGGTLPRDRSRQLNKILDVDLVERFTDAGRASGETLKAIEGKLGVHIRRYEGSVDGDQRAMADALKEAQAALRRMLERNNPGYGEELAAINKGWANFAVLRDAASRRGAKEGVMSPANLAGASRVADRSVGHGRTAEGRAMMQDLTEAGESVLATQFPNSGTFDRAILNSAMLGAGYIEPNVLLGAGAASLPYLPGLRNAMSAALTSRPQQAQAISDVVRKLSPYTVPAAVPLSQSLLGER